MAMEEAWQAEETKVWKSRTTCSRYTTFPVHWTAVREHQIRGGRNVLLTVWEAGKAMVKMPADSVSKFTDSTLLTWKGRGSLWSLFYKSTKPIHEASSLMT